MEISQETRDAMVAVAQKIVKAFSEAIKKFREWIQEDWQRLKGASIKLNQLNEEKKTVVRQRFKRDFKRRKFSHQVINRRPHCVVRKIIR